jgi:DNA-binding response OmpR family regulator
MEGTKRNILLVDNDMAFLRDAQASLENAGYRVIIKTNCLDVLSAFREGLAIDLVITADMMPGMDGLEFMAALRTKAFSIPVILLTEQADMNTYLKALNLGAYDYLYKPVGMSELNAIVKSALRSTMKGTIYAGHSPFDILSANRGIRGNDDAGHA